MNDDPLAQIASAPMHMRQIAIVFLCIALNSLDGLDALAISYASPGIASEWGIDKAALGVVLSMELFGMAAGSIFIGNIADRIGRRPVIVGCLTVMFVGMLGATGASGVLSLSVARLVTGLGIGGMLSSTSALVAEYANAKRRGLCATLNIAGYSVGAVTGGVIASSLLAAGHGWRSVFIVGGVATGIALPFAVWLLPESVDFLIAARPTNALERINRALRAIAKHPVLELPRRAAQLERSRFTALFTDGRAVQTCLLTVAYFAQIIPYYFVLKWSPKIIVDLGFPAAEAVRVLAFANLGGLGGAALVGFVAQVWRPRVLVICATLTGFVMLALFATGRHGIIEIGVILTAATFFVNSGVVGMYPILVHAFPTSLRATGTGFVIGLGRGGSALGPILVGALLARGFGVVAVTFAVGSGCLIAATALLLLPLARRDRAER